MKRASITSLALSALVALSACDPSVPETANNDATQPITSPVPVVYFANLKDGDKVKSPFRIVFGLHGLGVAPAGIDKPDTGHHHLLIDTTLSDEEMQFAIPKDDQHQHFGGGQTEVELSLGSGPHSLQLVLGDLNHEQFNPPVLSDRITIIVE